MELLMIGSIRKNLILLVLLAIIPTLGIVLYTGYELRQNVVQDAEEFSLHQVQAMAAHHERVVNNARLLLMTLANSSEIRTFDAVANQEILDGILTQNTAYVSLSLADTSGKVHVSALSSSIKQLAGFTNSQNNAFDFIASDLANESVFQRVLAIKSFTVGNYFYVKEIKRVFLQFANPVINKENEVVGVLVAAFDLSYLGQIFSDLHLPASSVFTLTDIQGMRLTRFPEAEKYTWVTDLPQMVARMSGKDEEGTFLESGVDGVSRLYGFKRIHFADASFPYLMIRLGIPVTQALSQARDVMLRNVILFLAAAVLSLFTAYLVGEKAIVRKINTLSKAAGRLGTGDLSARTGIASYQGELGQLALAFDQMADNLEKKDIENHQAKLECMQLNEELESKVQRRTEQLASANHELQALLEDLQKTQNQLVMSEKLAALGELVAGIAHEINTPVGVALSASSTLSEKIETIQSLFAKNEMKRSDLTNFLNDSTEGLEMTLVNLRRASDLIKSFKMVAADQVSENKRNFQVKKYIEEIILSLRPKLKKTSHQVEIVCDENLSIDNYPGAISQILTNFIINSLIHAFNEGEAGILRIEAIMEGKNLLLHYSDNGKGLSPEAQSKIFQPFFTTARAKGSTGLGMHIVYNLVTGKLGGSIRCESNPGEGTHFFVTIPV